MTLWEGNKYPTVDLNLGYNFSRLKAEIGILKFNQNAGLSYGLTGRWNIFNGWNNKREIQVAKLGIETGKLTKEQTALALKTDLFTVYNNYLTALDLNKVEEVNVRIAQKNLDITTEKMRFGTIDALELRQAQLNLVDVIFRKISVTFEARMAHLELMRLSGKLVAKVVSVFMQTTDYSPALKIEKAGNRVFEMRTYTATPNNLDDLNARFRDHTVKLFEKDRMTNLIYWNYMADQKGADKMLVYLLAHKSQDAAKASFAAFREDPAWVKVRTASEEKAGGSLTERKGGVVSEFMVPTDYSPLQ